jgi:IS5 family transposase
MRLCFSGLHTPYGASAVPIAVAPSQPLMPLALVIPWPTLADIVLPDLKRTTTKGKWWLGRRRKLRIHLGALLLPWLYDLTDRQVEWAMKAKAAYQLFCGCGLVDGWHAPDHTTSEEFRARLSPETPRQVAHHVAVWATELGLAAPSRRAIDATVQAANIAYPSDAPLMGKMTLLVNQVWMYMKKNVSFFVGFLPTVDVKAGKAQARAYGCRDRKSAQQKPTAFEELWHESFTQICPVKKYVDVLLDDAITRLPWHMRRAFEQVHESCSHFFLPVASCMCRGVMVPEKAVSFHAKAISCFNQGKRSKGRQCGRAFPLGRMGGNFLLVGSWTSLRMEDTDSVRPMIGDHQEICGQGTLTSCGTDKGDYSAANRQYRQS